MPVAATAKQAVATTEGQEHSASTELTRVRGGHLAPTEPTKGGEEETRKNLTNAIGGMIACKTPQPQRLGGCQFPQWLNRRPQPQRGRGISLFFASFRRASKYYPRTKVARFQTASDGQQKVERLKKKWRGFRKRHGSDGFGRIVRSGADSDDWQELVQLQMVPKMARFQKVARPQTASDGSPKVAQLRN